MSRYATPDMMPALQLIWNACFGDAPEYTAFLFGRLLKPERILVREDEGAPASMLCTEPFELRTAKGSAKGAYIFGVATHPGRQGRGHSTALLEEAHKALRLEGCALTVLVPAGDSLFRFYGERGYETAFEMAKVEFPASRLVPAKETCTVLPASLPDLAELRDRYCKACSMYVCWSRSYLAYIDAECRQFGGEVVRIAARPFKGYAVCYRVPERHMVIIKELAVPSVYLDDAMAALHMRYHAQNYLAYLPADTPGFQRKGLPFAMVRWYDKVKRGKLCAAQGKAPWITHVLD